MPNEKCCSNCHYEIIFCGQLSCINTFGKVTNEEVQKEYLKCGEHFTYFKKFTG